MIIQSNDPDEPEVEIELAGHGIAPMIQLTPMWYDFGQPYVDTLLPPGEFVPAITNLNIVKS